MDLNFIDGLKQKALQNESKKEKEQIEVKLKRKASETAPKRFQKSKSKKMSSSSTPNRRKAPVVPIVPTPPEYSRPVSLSTAPICPHVSLKHILQVSAEHIVPEDDGMMFLPDFDDGKVSFSVKGVRYEAAAIRAIMENGVLKLLLYSSVTEDEDVLKPPKPSDTFVTVTF
ncbi:MAG: hypothetical protein CMP20_10435 [Rickettsiales bacterium]|nr:hypothetical protein [Rickettsiales bacterium]